MKLRSSSLIVLMFLILAAFGGRANAQSCIGWLVGNVGPGYPNTYYYASEPPTWCSSNGSTYFTFQSDGNLVVYYEAPAFGLTAEWASNTYETGWQFALQSDENLVIYSTWDRTKPRLPLWSSGTDQNIGGFLDVQDDGNVVLYEFYSGKVLWATNTNQPQP